MSAASLIAAQQEFTAHLLALQNAARWAFGRGRRLRRQDYEEVLAEVCAAAWSAWVGLLRRGKDPVQVGIHGIANNAVRYVRNGRRVGNQSGGGRGAMDVYHPEAQKDCGFRVINSDSLEETISGSAPGSGPTTARRPTKHASGSITRSGSGLSHPGGGESPNC